MLNAGPAAATGWPWWPTRSAARPLPPISPTRSWPSQRASRPPAGSDGYAGVFHAAGTGCDDMARPGARGVRGGRPARAENAAVDADRNGRLADRGEAAGQFTAGLRAAGAGVRAPPATLAEQPGMHHRFDSGSAQRLSSAAAHDPGCGAGRHSAIDLQRRAFPASAIAQPAQPDASRLGAVLAG